MIPSVSEVGLKRTKNIPLAVAYPDQGQCNPSLEGIDHKVLSERGPTLSQVGVMSECLNTL